MLVFQARYVRRIEVFTQAYTPHKKSKLAPLQERRMIDKVKVFAKAGDGGHGCTSFRRSRHDSLGRAD
ncbi:GTP1/OBG domain superfamily, partial [Sesbania bispinosa]